MSNKPSVPKGTRDFLPSTVAKRTYLFNTIKKAFQLFGFVPIETPSFEHSHTLMGKYGEEGDRLIFRILNSGEKMKKADFEALNNNQLGKFANSVSEKALRYDLTVPFARFVVQHQNELSFPFKRYQIQPVWRADRPQASRYQEFYQCDADVVGSDSLVYEVDFIQLFDYVLSDLGLPGFTIKINNRKILSGIAEVTGEADNLIAITVAIDKLDKIGPDGVVKELQERGIKQEAIAQLTPLFTLDGSTEERLSAVRTLLATSEIGLQGVAELEEVIAQTAVLGLNKGTLEFDVTLARGLNYYTGAIFEVKAHGVSIGSICGGGRYDDLTGLFGLKGMPGIGISFGADRIFDVMEQLDLFPAETTAGLSVLFVNFGENEANAAQKMIKELRLAGVDAALYPSAAKMAKQMTYANNINAKFVVLLGENELNTGILQVKEMQTGTQHQLTLEELKEQLKK